MNWLDVRWYTFRDPDKRRPVLVLTRPSVVETIQRVVVAGVTSTIRNIPSEVPLDENDGLPMQCAVNFDNIFTVDRQKIEGDSAFITSLRGPVVLELRDALLAAFGFSD